MTAFAADPRTLAAPGTGGTLFRWGLAAATVAAAYAAAIWMAFALAPPPGAVGELQDAVMIELEPLTAIEEAPPPAPEPEVVEETTPEPMPAPVEEVAPEPPPPEPVAEEPPPEPVVPEEVAPPEPVVPDPVIPEPVVEETPPVPEPLPEPVPVPEPIQEPEPLPEPTTEEVVPDLIETDAIAASVLNPPIPQLRPPPPRPVEKVERKPPVEKRKVAEKPRRKTEPVKKPERQQKIAETQAPVSRSSAARSEAPPASRSASAPRVSSASWQRRAVSHFRKFRRIAATNGRGTARVTLTIDRSGRVLSASLASSSGNPVLDSEAVALVRRASPIPAPPDGVGGRTIPLTVPINVR